MRLDSIAKIACFCANRSFFKNFWVSLEHFVTIHYLPHLNLSQTHRVTLNNLHFCFISTSNLQENGMGFLFLTTYGCYHVLVSLFKLINWSVLVGKSHTHDNMSHCHMLFVWDFCDILCLWVWLVQYGWAIMVGV